VRRAEPLAHSRHARQDLARDHHAVADRFQLAKAIVAGAAIRLVEPVAEIGDEMTVAAADPRRVPLDVAQQ